MLPETVLRTDDVAPDIRFDDRPVARSESARAHRRAASPHRLAARPRFGRGYGCTTILRPTPALNWSIACGYCSSGSRSLMKTAGSSTPLAKSAAARS